MVCALAFMENYKGPRHVKTQNVTYVKLKIGFMLVLPIKPDFLDLWVTYGSRINGFSGRPVTWREPVPVSAQAATVNSSMSSAFVDVLSYHGHVRIPEFMKDGNIKCICIVLYKATLFSFNALGERPISTPEPRFWGLFERAH